MTEQEYNPDFPTETVQEGKVKILVPKLSEYGVIPSDYAPSRAPVFYNPIMEFNRDLSVLALQTYQTIINHEIRICEPLTSQGIRAIRYAKEINSVKNVLISDINKHAYDLAKHNIKLNSLEDIVDIKLKDANCVLSCNASPKKRFDIIDIDPFGTPAPYLDSAFRATKNKGLIAATATDLAPLCGVHSKACIRKYGGKPLRAEYCHELAIRLLIASMAAVAAQHDIGLSVLFSHSSNHYIRVYTQIKYGCKQSDETLKNIGYLLHCFNCMHREMTNHPFSNLSCPECTNRMDYAGPLWTAAINNQSFVKQMLSANQNSNFKNKKRIDRLLGLIEKEAEAPPTYYVIDKLSKKLGLPAPSNKIFLQKLANSGFNAVPTHFNPRGIKTTASSLEMQQLLKQTITSSITPELKTDQE
jgi:tRNA (guanine26-N2/guanine27-N2)-dimethyltransferase